MKLIIVPIILMSLAACGKTQTPQEIEQVTTPTVQACTVTTTPEGAMITCPDGTSSFINNGTNGLDGLNGANGLNGLAGTQITVVQFCDSGFVPTYPSVFPEIGLCISNQLIGVYSANGGFLAPLPPGSYSSDGINASCNFTITSGCLVTD